MAMVGDDGDGGQEATTTAAADQNITTAMVDQKITTAMVDQKITATMVDQERKGQGRSQNSIPTVASYNIPNPIYRWP